MSPITPPPVKQNCLPTTPQEKQQGINPNLTHGIAFVTTDSETQRNLKYARSRATRILGAQPVQVDGETRGDNDVVVKVSWPGESRQNEARIIDLAREAVLICHHLIDHHDLDCDTCQIGDDLGISKTSSHMSHVHRRLLFEKSNPISSLSGEDFMTAWIQCYRCHFRLRLHGIEHGHVTKSNLMVNSVTGTGVLNDYDIPVFKKKNQNGSIIGTEYIDAIPFMALDLLTKDFFDGKIRRIYRHDNESFIWVLPWVFLRGKHWQAGELNRWATSDFVGCQAQKFRFLYQSDEYVGYPEANVRPYEAASQLLAWLFKKLCREKDAKRVCERARPSKNGDAALMGLWNDPSEKAACMYFRQFEAELKAGWDYGFEPLPEGQTVPLKDEEPIKLD
ncbi:hypothetical protein JAAARDRAFT_31234 [Jaapia argillacea MUCL 33604]|uniref:Fungal-type protein kinase domain-containing protein n=1 Tax=Jaapia argillacea MUCL 33604 TaxID=933084 RepID=A0A067Q437_9AGAM|nr:hypothetical protein JAAARDRAFT_31234 [Jaapia argillacea MUCL 33604]